MRQEMTLLFPSRRSCRDDREARVEKEAQCGICADSEFRVASVHLRHVLASGVFSQRTHQPGASVSVATAEADRGGNGLSEDPFFRGDRSIGYA